MNEIDQIPKRKRRLDIVNEIESLDNMNVVSLSSFSNSSHTSIGDYEDDTHKENDDEWFDTLLSIGKSSSKKKSKGVFKDLDEVLTGKKKKKKKNKKGELTDYNKEFETEINLLKNLLVEQNRFVDDLQGKYDAMKKQKSTARGIGKFENDLVSNINTARKTSMDLVKEVISTKKTIADLTFKEKKEFGVSSGEGNNSADYASNFLKQLISVDRKSIAGDNSVEFDDIDDTDDLFDATSDALYSSEDYVSRNSEVDRYLINEHRGVKTYVVYERDNESWYFIAKDKDGIEIEDYPVPEPMTKLSFNFSTGIAKDTFGESYTIIEV